MISPFSAEFINMYEPKRLSPQYKSHHYLSFCAMKTHGGEHQNHNWPVSSRSTFIHDLFLIIIKSHSLCSFSCVRDINYYFFDFTYELCSGFWWHLYFKYAVDFFCQLQKINTRIFSRNKEHCFLSQRIAPFSLYIYLCINAFYIGITNI